MELDATQNGMTRREAAKRLLGVVSAGALFPFGAADHPVWKHLANDVLMNEAEATGAEASPTFLSADQHTSLVAIAETIVPGSTKAKVADFIDLLLGVDTKKNQAEFVESLEQMESESQKKFSKGFTVLAEAQRAELLGMMATSAQFENLKTWVAGAYYSSEIGMRELGWTPNRFFPQFPGCEHPEEHASH